MHFLAADIFHCNYFSGDAVLDETTREALKTYKQCMKSRPLSEAFKFIKHGGHLRDLDTRNTVATENST